MSNAATDLWYTRCPVPTAFGIATRGHRLVGDYDEVGVTLRSLASSTSAEVRQAHFEQSQPRSFRHGGNIPPLVSASRGADIRIIGLSWLPSNATLLAMPGSGIESAADLRGKRIGIPRRVNESIDFWRAGVLQGVERALERGGLGWDDVEAVDLPVLRTFVDDSTGSTAEDASLWDATFMLTFQREETAALLGGAVDAIYSEGANAVITKAVTGAVRAVELGGEEPAPTLVNGQRPLTLTVSGELLAERPDLVDICVASALKTAAWARQNPVDARREIAGEIGIAEELVERSYTDGVIDSLAVGLDPAMIAALQTQHDFLHANGFIENPIRVADLVDEGPLRRVSAQAAADRAGIEVAA
ncbi:MAG TPA: ABC transporter substrate-binding protein [Solirubrobacterales bacterium]